MAAAYETTIFADMPNERLCEVLEIAAKNVYEHYPRFRVIEQTATSAVFRKGFNFYSWGECITVTLELKSFRVVSECSFPLQVIDWGKNRKNVELFRTYLKKALVSVHSQTSA